MELGRVELPSQALGKHYTPIGGLIEPGTVPWEGRDTLKASLRLECITCDHQKRERQVLRYIAERFRCKLAP